MGEQVGGYGYGGYINGVDQLQKLTKADKDLEREQRTPQRLELAVEL